MSVIRGLASRRELASRDERLAVALLVVGVGLVPWTIYLIFALPSRHVQDEFYDLAWAGFDVLLATMLILTGVGLLKRRAWVQGVAASAATLLVCDAWFDILSAHGGGERLHAILLALFAELPTAAVCVYIVHDAEAATTRAQRWLARRSEPNS
jgi:hypothetical protein